jgi:hypothetical protein
MACRMPFGQAIKLTTHLIFNIFPDVFLVIAYTYPSALSA